MWLLVKWSFIVTVALLVLLTIAVNLPPVQQLAIEKGAKWFNKKTGGSLNIERFELRIPSYLAIEGLELYSPDSIHIAGMESLELKLGWRKLFNNKAVVDNLRIIGLNANIYSDTLGTWNYDFIVNAFAANEADTLTKPAASGTSWGVELKKLNLQGIDLRYSDALSRDSFLVSFQDLRIRSSDFSLIKQTFEFEKIYLAGAEIHAQLGYHGDSAATKDVTEANPQAAATEADTTEALPRIGIELILLEDHHLYFTDLGDGSRYEASLGKLQLETKEIDLNKDLYLIDALSVAALDLEIYLPDSPPSDTPFDGEIWAPLNIYANEFSIEGFDFKMFTFSDKAAIGESEASIILSDVYLQVEDLKASDEGYALELLSGQLRYDDLPQLNKIAFRLDLGPEAVSLSGLDFSMGKTVGKADLQLSYPSLAKLVNDNAFSEARIGLNRLSVHPDDIAALLTFVNPDSALPTLPNRPIEASALLTGNYKAIGIQQLSLGTGASKISISGHTKGESLNAHRIELDALDVLVLMQDVAHWLPDSLDRNMLPGSIQFAGKAKAGPQYSALDGLLSLPPFGDLEIDVRSGGWKSESYDLVAEVNSAMIDLGSLLQSDTAFTCFGLTADLKDLATDSMRGHLTLDIPEFRKDALNVRNIFVSDTLDGDLHRFGVMANDSSLIANVKGTALLTNGVDVVLNASVSGADFQYLGISKKDIRLSTDFSAYYVQIDSVQRGAVNIGTSVVVQSNERIDIQPMSANFFLGPDSTGINISGELLSLNSTSNLSIDSLMTRVQNLFKQNIPDNELSDAYWNLDFRSGDSELIRDLLLSDLKEFEPAVARIRYVGAERKLDVNFSMPLVEYGSLRIDSTSLDLRSTKGSTTGDFSIKNISIDTLVINQLNLSVAPDSVGTLFKLSIGGAPDQAPYQIGVNLSHQQDPTTHWLLKPQTEIYLASKPWQVDEDACVRFKESGTEISDLRLSRNQQELRFSKNEKDEVLHFGAQRFKLNALGSIFSQKEALFDGVLSAGLDLNADGTFEGDGLIEDLVIAGANFGSLDFAGEAEENLYRLSANFAGESLDLKSQGTIQVEDDGSQKLDLKVDVGRFAAKTLENIAPSLFAQASGDVSGQIRIGGTSGNPELKGALTFKDVSLRVSGGGLYALRNEEIRIEPDAFVFPNFNIRDSTSQSLIVNGKVMHKNFSDLRFDLNIRSDRFTMLDVKKGEDPNFYGTLIVGSDIKITGTQTRPVVRSDISLKRGSEMVFTVPESDYNSFEDDGLIEWVDFNAEKVPNILRKDKENEASPSILSETIIDLAGNLNIDKETKFRIIIDPLAGDYLEIEGGGKLALGYDRAGRISLSGTYTVSSGAYQMTFYNIVKRKFLLEPGSRITWNGDPFSADLNLTAIYPTRASAMGLLSTGGAGSEGLRRMFDWEVLMAITGEIEQPEVGFDLRLDKSSQSSRGSLQGAIESRLVQLRENESELNMQVFALMVFNTFISEGGSGTSGSEMVGNQARNSASQLLTQQLNNMSDKLVGGVELTFDLQSYGSEGATETDLSVDLSKALFDERVVVSMGSTFALEQNNAMADNSQQMMTNFVVEYKITNDGRYRLKAFRKTDVEDILVGRITRTGAGLVFRRSFDRGDQIFKKDKSEKELEAELEAERERLKQEKNAIKNNGKGKATDSKSDSEKKLSKDKEDNGL